MPAAFDEPVVCPRQIGRDVQLDALRQVAASVATGAGQTVLVAGEAGIGKSRLAPRQPLLLVIEDLHWADDTSLELLAVLARRVPREPILLLGTYRDDEVG